jgi:cell division protein ZipA
MEDNFRNVLIIISVVVISAIFIHGLWTIRKQKNPYKLKASKDKIDPISRDFDGSGFDQDGVSQVKVKPAQEKTEQPKEERVEPNFATHLDDDKVKATNITIDAQQTELDLTPPTNDVLDQTQSANWPNGHSEAPKNFSKEELGDDLVLSTDNNKAAIKREPLYQQPVTKAKPSRVKEFVAKETVNKDQAEIDFANCAIENEEPTPEVEIAKPVHHENLKPEPQVIALSVVMPANQQMLGAALLPSLLTLGLKYGEMNIFHRHQDNAGNGDVTFSLANMMKPGSFELDSMETFATVGVSLFMMLPNNGDSLVVYDQMLNAAKQLAQEFGAQLLDDKRNVMTPQTEQHYISKIREFDRQSHLVSV